MFFKNINFDIDNLRTNENHEITKEEIMDIDVDYELIKKDINDPVDSKLDEQLVIKKLEEIDVIDPIQVLDDGEKIYSNEKNKANPQSAKKWRYNNIKMFGCSKRCCFVE